MLLSSMDTLLYLLQYYLLCGHFARAVSNMMNIFFTILFFNFFEDFVMLIVHTQVTTYISFYFYILITKIADINLWLIIDSNLDKTRHYIFKKTIHEYFHLMLFRNFTLPVYYDNALCYWKIFFIQWHTSLNKYFHILVLDLMAAW